LIRGDVRALSDRTFDVITAMNFSWAILDDGALDAYLAAAFDCLEDDGMLVLELFGGSEMERPLVREHRLDGFTYVWDQRAFEHGVLDARMHFRVGGREIRDAFTYQFHLRPLAALRDRLVRAGCRRSDLCVRDRRGNYRVSHGEPRSPLWRGYLLGMR
jgi:hypothetical protein